MIDDLLRKEKYGVLKRKAELESLTARDLPYDRALKKKNALEVDNDIVHTMS
jgi:hypothetical protein